MRVLCWLSLWLAIAPGIGRADDVLKAEARTALHRAVKFYRTQVGSHGGYLYRYSADLKKQEGEGVATRETVWVQPPGTPTVGLAYLNAFARMRDPLLLEAAEAAGECLIQGQLRSGGWSAQIDFDPQDRLKWAYRVDPETKKKGFNVSTFDDDKTQSALRLLIGLDAALSFKDKRVHAATMFALESVLAAQFSHGGWAQGFDGPPDEPADPQARPTKARFPDEWSRTYPGGKYWFLATFNDDAIADTIHVLLLAAKTYKEPRYRAAALKAGDFILLAQLPEPQPAWAQQYDAQLQPAWARKFEPPAISGSESQRLLQTLMDLYVETQDRKYLAPIPPALAYLRRSEISPGRVARFYELRTNRPLYFNRQYELTYDDSDLPTHYGFKIGSKVDSIEKRFEKVRNLSREKLEAERSRQFELSSSRPESSEVRSLIKSLDERGAWIEEGTLKYHGKSDSTRRVIDSATFARNLETLSRYLATTEGK